MLFATNKFSGKTWKRYTRLQREITFVAQFTPVSPTQNPGFKILTRVGNIRLGARANTNLCNDSVIKKTFNRETLTNYKFCVILILQKNSEKKFY